MSTALRSRAYKKSSRRLCRRSFPPPSSISSSTLMSYARAAMTFFHRPDPVNRRLLIRYDADSASYEFTEKTQRPGLQAVMHDIKALLAMAQRQPQQNQCWDFESALDPQGPLHRPFKHEFRRKLRAKRWRSTTNWLSNQNDQAAL